MQKLLLIALLISTVTCATITVPWVYGMTPQKVNVVPGDTLLWKWSSKYTVANCTLAEFHRCDCSEIMASSSPFSWVVPDTEGTFFFASSVGSHCSDGGVKLVVTVSKESKDSKLSLNKRQTDSNNQDIYLQPPMFTTPNTNQPPAVGTPITTMPTQNSTQNSTVDYSLCYDSCYYVWYNLCQNLWYNLTMYNITTPSYNFTTLCNQSTSFDNLTVTWNNWTNPWNSTYNNTDMAMANFTVNPCWIIWFNTTNVTSSDNSSLGNSTMLDNSTQYANASMLMLANPWTNSTSSWFNMTAFCQNPCALQNVNSSDNSTVNPYENFGDFFSNMTCWLSASDIWTMTWQNSSLSNSSSWSNFSSPCFGLWYQLCYVPWNTSMTESESSQTAPSTVGGSGSSQPVNSTVEQSTGPDNTSICYNPCYYTWYNLCYELWYNQTFYNMESTMYNFTLLCNETTFNNLSGVWNNFTNPWTNITFDNTTMIMERLNVNPCFNAWSNLTAYDVESWTMENQIESLYLNWTSPQFNLTSFCSSPCGYFMNETDVYNYNPWANYTDYFLNSSTPCAYSSFNASSSNISDWLSSAPMSPCFTLWYQLCYINLNASDNSSNTDNSTSSAGTPDNSTSSTGVPDNSQYGSPTTYLPMPSPSDLNTSLCYNPCYYTWYTLCFDLWYNQTYLNETNPIYNFTAICAQTNMTWENVTSTWNNFSNPWISADSQTVQATLISDPCWSAWYNITWSQDNADSQMFSNVTELLHNLTSCTFNITDFCNEPCAYYLNGTDSMSQWSSYPDMMLNSSGPCGSMPSSYNWTDSSQFSESNFTSPCFNLWYGICYAQPGMTAVTVPVTSTPVSVTPITVPVTVPVTVPSTNFTDNMTVCFNPCYYAWYHLCYQLWYNETVLNMTDSMYNFTTVCNQSISFSNITSNWTNFANPWVNGSNPWANVMQPNVTLNFTSEDQMHPCWNTWYNTTQVPQQVNITIPTNCSAESNITSVWQNITSPMFDLSNFCASPCMYFWNSTDNTTSIWSNYSDYFLNSSSPCSNTTFNVSTPNVTNWLNVSSPCFNIWYELCYVPWNNSNSANSSLWSTLPTGTDNSTSSNDTSIWTSSPGTDNSTSSNYTQACSNPCFDLWYRICFDSKITGPTLQGMIANATQEWYNSTTAGPCYNPWYTETVDNTTDWCLTVKENGTNPFFNENQFANYVWSCYDALIQDSSSPSVIQEYLNSNNVSMSSSGIVSNVSIMALFMSALISLLL